MPKELIYFPSWTAGRAGYASRIHEFLEEYLSKQGQRLTKPRHLIVDFLLKADQHVTSEEIHQALKSKGVGKATVFRTLNMLEECHLVERVSSVNGLPKFEIKYERPHHDHLICIKCGYILEVQWPEVEKVQDKTCRRNGFTPLWHRHEMFGICRNCSTKTAS